MLSIVPETTRTNIDFEVQDILASLELYSSQIYELGYSVSPYSQRSLHLLMNLTDQQRKQVRVRFQRFAQFMAESSAGLKGQGDDRFFLELCAERLGLIFDKGVYDIIKGGDLVEIYSVDLVQIFRNFAFFDVCSYSLLDLMTYEFFELYDRSQLVNQYIMEATAEISQRPFNLSPLNLAHVPAHLLQEKFSQDKLTCMAKFKWMYPVYTWPQNLFGYLVILEGEVLSELPKAHLAFI